MKKLVIILFMFGSLYAEESTKFRINDLQSRLNDLNREYIQYIRDSKSKELKLVDQLIILQNENTKLKMENRELIRWSKIPPIPSSNVRFFVSGNTEVKKWLIIDLMKN